MRAFSFLIAVSSATILAGAVHAADLGYGLSPTPAPYIADAFGWTGGYLGVFGGASAADFKFPVSYSVGAAPADTGSLDVDGGGLLGGVQIGYDFEYYNYVFGAVADIAASSIDADVNATVAGIGSARAKDELKYLGTVRARLGVGFDRVLPYVHGGFAYGKTEQTLSVSGVGSISEDDTKTGWVVGAGVEYAITPHVSFQTEYSYTDLGKDTIYAGELTGGDNLKISEELDFHTVRAGINYRF
ncbi:outer membrane protein [Consotaella salsifontis]|uniref:Outer membrane immunogenic protein n=1 Tax=Consotaella salsifontis TaxID=1365950 RepID=A0A1T4T229_9HYPH|nr:outer membrane protein [Consotaella salsifontis]SKA34570.1 outer membrane immunogenic protein [Consotaella salsifontis]